MSECKYVSPSPVNKNETWINRYWRPMMGWLYFLICLADFIVFPVAWSLLQSSAEGAIATQWIPITLHGAGFLHISMGAILGITAYGRSQEKMCQINRGPPYHPIDN